MDPDNIRTNLHVKNHKRGLNAVDEVKCPILKEFNENKWDILLELKRKQLLFLCFWYPPAVRTCSIQWFKLFSKACCFYTR